MNVKRLLVFSLLVFAIGCKFPNKSVARLWFYTYRTGPVAGQDNGLTPASFLYLRKDGTYTRDIGFYEYGTWLLKDEEIILTNSKDRSTHLPIKYLQENEMQLVLADHSVANFESLPGSFATPGNNPFSRENNTWRIPASKKENEIAIRKRLSAHFRFWEIYFTWAMENELASIDVRSTPTLVKIYGNGFSLKPTGELPPEWKALFFDNEDCEKANDMVKHVFETSDIAWAQTQNKYKMFVSAFQQLQRKF